MNRSETPASVQLDAVGPDTVLTRVASPRLEWVEVDGEIVAWDTAGEQLHLLDRTASLIFQLCDGEATLGQTVSDLAALFDHSSSSIEADVHACAARLCHDGLLQVTG